MNSDDQEYADLVIRTAAAQADVGELAANLLFRQWAVNVTIQGSLSAVKSRARLFYPGGVDGRWDIVIEQLRPSDSLPVTAETLAEPPDDAVSWRSVLTQSTPMEVMLAVAEMAAAEPDFIDLDALLDSVREDDEDDDEDGDGKIDLPL